MTGLRSELSFIAERNRINDRKQQQLEQIISQMEDQAASYSTQLIQLEERLADKDMIVNSLEGKLNEKNVRVVEVKAELDNTLDKNNKLQHEVGTWLPSATTQLNELSQAYLTSHQFLFSSRRLV
jgi:chromosome segregation ATPase